MEATQMKARVVANGQPGHSDIVYGFVEKLAAAFLAVTTALAIAGMIGGVRLLARVERMEGRQIASEELSRQTTLAAVTAAAEAAKAAASVSADLKKHEEWSREVLQTLVRRDEFMFREQYTKR